MAGETDYVLTVVARDVAELHNVLAGLASHGGQRLVTYLRTKSVQQNKTQLPVLDFLIHSH